MLRGRLRRFCDSFAVGRDFRLFFHLFVPIGEFDFAVEAFLEQLCVFFVGFHVAALHGYGLMATYERAGGGQDADGVRS